MAEAIHWFRSKYDAEDYLAKRFGIACAARKASMKNSKRKRIPKNKITWQAGDLGHFSATGSDASIPDCVFQVLEWSSR